MPLAKYVKFREESFGGVLFETRSERVYTLTPSAAAVVRELAEGRSAPEAASRLAERYEAAEGTIASEVNAFVIELRSKGLVED
jgi:hypothetical protein